jgi:hypothetical protein
MGLKRFNRFISCPNVTISMSERMVSGNALSFDW